MSAFNGQRRLHTLRWITLMHRIKLCLHVPYYTQLEESIFYHLQQYECHLYPLICVILNCKGKFIVPIWQFKMSNDRGHNSSQIAEQSQGQFTSLDWNSVCSITQSEKTGETIHQIPRSVCMCMHGYALIWPQHIGTKPSRGA